MRGEAEKLEEAEKLLVIYTRFLDKGGSLADRAH